LSFKIRTAKKIDLTTCAKILTKEFRKQGENWTQDSAEKRLAELIKDNPNLCFCLEIDKKIIGFAFAERFTYIKGEYLWISEFAIEAENQGKGFGVKTLQFMEKLGKEKGFNVLYLAANVNEKAYKTYEKFGFENTNYCFMEKCL